MKRSLAKIVFVLSLVLSIAAVVAFVYCDRTLFYNGLTMADMAYKNMLHLAAYLPGAIILLTSSAILSWCYFKDGGFLIKQ